jgi:Domain of unknown function (DUF6429)
MSRHDPEEACSMDQEIDPNRIDDAVLALLWLGLHEGWRTWKGFDRDALDRLRRKGMVSDPMGKAESVVFTEEGRREAERLLRELLARHRPRLPQLGSDRRPCMTGREARG